MCNRPLVPKTFKVPVIFCSDKLILKPLTVSNLIKDYDAVMSSDDHLNGLMYTEYNLPVSLTIEVNFIDLG